MVDPDTFLTTLYVMVDEFCQYHLLPEVHPGPPASRSRSEVVTLGLFEPWACFPGERAFYRYAQRHLRAAFPRCRIAPSSIACCAVTMRPLWRASCTWLTSWTVAGGSLTLWTHRRSRRGMPNGAVPAGCQAWPIAAGVTAWAGTKASTCSWRSIHRGS